MEAATKLFGKEVIDGFVVALELLQVSVSNGHKNRAMRVIRQLSVGHEVALEFHNEKQREEKGMQRGMFTFYIAPSIPSKETLNAIVKFCQRDRILEINARRGLWGAFLTILQVDITMVERVDRMGEYSFGAVIPCESVKDYFDENQDNFTTLMVCRNDVNGDNETALHCVRSFTGKKIVFIGVAADECFKWLQESDIWDIVGDPNMETWSGVGDFIVLYAKLPKRSILKN